MSLLAPLSLLALLPWAAVVWLTWRGRSLSVAIPFARLWPTSPIPRGRLTRKRPPLPILLVLLSALVAILAASRPVLAPTRTLGSIKLTVITDHCRDTLAAGRLEEMTTRLQQAIDATTSEANLNDVHVDSHERLLPAIGEALRKGEAVVAMTERTLWDDDRLYRLAPSTPAPNAAITYIAIDGSQLLARIECGDEAPIGPAMLQIFEQAFPVVLPAAGESKDIIFTLADIPADAVEVRLDAEGDTWSGDDVYILALVRAWPQIETRNVAQSFRRFAVVFGEQRRPRERSMGIVIAPEPIDGPSIIVSPTTREVAGPIRLSNFAPALGIDWNELRSLLAAEPPDSSWTPAASTQEAVLLAFRETAEGRQIWMGFSATGFEQTPEFVRLLADSVEWINGGPAEWGPRIGDLNRPRQSLLAAEPPDEQALRVFLQRHRIGLPLARPLAITGAIIGALAGLGGLVALKRTLPVVQGATLDTHQTDV